MLTIMLTFGGSYLIRVLCDSFIIDYNRLDCYQGMMVDQFIAVPFDLVPIMLIVCLHRRNLMTNSGQGGGATKKLAKYVDEEDVLMVPMGGSDTSSSNTNSHLTTSQQQNEIFDRNGAKKIHSASLISLQKLTQSNDDDNEDGRHLTIAQSANMVARSSTMNHRSSSANAVC